MRFVRLSLINYMYMYFKPSVEIVEGAANLTEVLFVDMIMTVHAYNVKECLTVLQFYEHYFALFYVRECACMVRGNREILGFGNGLMASWLIIRLFSSLREYILKEAKCCRKASEIFLSIF
ncbi:hypothetical protein DINM_004643 [Dirofilaria immitis]|nr:hypothetical protein [Dirofilaria immitis]